MRRKPMPQDAVLQKMKQDNIPLTLANYVELAWFGSKTPEQLEGEEMFELPARFQKQALRLVTR